MPRAEGFIQGFHHEHADPVAFSIQIDENAFPIALGNNLSIRFLGDKACVHCGRRVKKLYQNGYCFPCIQSLAECDLCIVKPHECHFHLGTCRDEPWAQTHCMIPHYVYLAVSSSVKVGLTRKGRELTRWMEQGAEQAVLVAEVPTRKMAGELEMEIAKNIPDKTNWRKMLQTHGQRIDLQSVKQEVIASLPETWSEYLLKDDAQEHQFLFPRDTDFEPTLKGISLDKTHEVQGVIRGLKGQYLIFDDGVFNLRKHAGYQVQISVS